MRSPKLLAYEYEYHAKEVRHPLLGAIFGSKRVIDLPTLESGPKRKLKAKKVREAVLKVKQGWTKQNLSTCHEA